ncbi:MAG TPA: universal stress protein [Kofleriaceae bacterium]|nr:universal stress protein [Kofleriaceae bacterium]
MIGDGLDKRSDQTGRSRARGSRILVPVDFSVCSLAALSHAAAMARPSRGSIDVLHVWPLAHPLALEALAASAGMTVVELAESEAAEALAAVMADLEDRGVAGPRGRVECGEPADVILRAARDGGYDLIVMGTHGHGGLADRVRGSVAEQVIRRAPCPVLTIRVDTPAARPDEAEPS